MRNIAILSSIVLVILSSCSSKTVNTDFPAPALPQIPDREVVLTDFGAESASLCTEAFTAAIAHLDSLGGGTLQIPAGEWHTGPIILRSHIRMNLQKGALVKFSPEMSIYKSRDELFGTGEYKRQAPIVAYKATDIAITGEGIIDGSGEYWRPIRKEYATAEEWARLMKDTPDALEFVRSQRLSDEDAARYESAKTTRGAVGMRRQRAGFYVPRFLRPEDGVPEYVHRRGSNVGNGEYYTDQDPASTIAHYGSCAWVNPDALEREYEALCQEDIKQLTATSPLLYPKQNRAVDEYFYNPSPIMAPGRREVMTVKDILEAQQPGGGWITPLVQISNVYKPLPEGLAPSASSKYATTFVGDEYDTSPYTPDEPVYGYSTKDFISYMTQLINFVK